MVEPPVEPPVAPPRPAAEKKFFIALAGGHRFRMGSQRLGRERRRARRSVRGAEHWARVAHLAPQIGYFVTPNLMIGVQGRFQLVTGAKDYHLGPGARQ